MKEQKRIWELDFIRGVAIIGMILTHINYDFLNYHNKSIFPPIASDVLGFLILYGGALFLIISGICCCLSKNNLKRGLTLFFVAMGVTYVTVIYQYMFSPEYTSTIFFGVLHCLSLCMVISHFLMKIPQKKYITNPILFVLGILIIIAGILLKDNDINLPIVCGNVIKPWFMTMDYFPLFPYLGWFIIGIVIGRIFYQKGRALIKSEKIGNFFLIRAFSFVGRHSLIFYLAHQPIIFGIMMFINV